jgi:hypothetical protein
MDFAAPSDHNTKGDDWIKTVQALEEFDSPGSFAAFFGWESGSRHGHENLYFTDPDHPLVCGGKAGFSGGFPDRAREIYKKYSGFILIPHHTNAVSETRDPESDRPMWHTYPWSEPFESLRLVEIMQTRGNQERNNYTDPWRGWHQGNGSSAQDALSRGYRIGFTGGTDNHCAWPGRAYASHEGGLMHSPKSVILTGVWAEKIERNSIYNALWKRHTWAVWDTRAIVWYQLNGKLMGDELELKRGEKLRAFIKISAQDALQSIEIISDGETKWISSFSDLDIAVEVDLGPAEKSAYFYLRALQRDGGIIYASPVFLTVKD